MARLHRNNAAEWVMVIVLTPLVWIALGWRKMGDRKKVQPHRASTEPSGSAAGRFKRA
jgi:hypothetical protein